MQTIALFGGSFDPPHIGHEAIVKKVLSLNDVEKVIIMPTFLNPFKSTVHAPSNLRIQWLKEIFAAYSNVEVSSYEVDLKRKVPSIESVSYLLKRYKKIYLIIGADNLELLPQWKDYNKLKTLVTFVVASRDNIKIPDGFLHLDVEESISSTQLRKDMDSSKLSKIASEEITQFYKENN